MRTKAFILLAFLITIMGSGSLYSQNPGTSGLSLFKDRGADFGMSIGSSYTSGFGQGSIFSQNIAPFMNWNINQKWQLTVGTIFSSSRFNGFQNFSPGTFSQNYQVPDRLFSTTIYAFGSYQMNPKLTLFGGSWLENNNMPGLNEVQMNPQAFNINGKGLMFGMEYRISENFRVGAELRMSSGYNPYNPFAPGLFHNNSSFRNTDGF